MADAMPQVRSATTAELAPAELSAIRSLLERAFDGDFSEHDWQHCLGGLHALAYSETALVGHGSVVERRFEHDGRQMKTGYVEGLAVLREHRRHGHGAAIMRALEAHVRQGYELGALAATAEAIGFYAARGWVRWTGATEPDGEGAIHVLPLALPVDPSGTLRADWREGDVW